MQEKLVKQNKKLEKDKKKLKNQKQAPKKKTSGKVFQAKRNDSSENRGEEDFGGIDLPLTIVPSQFLLKRPFYKSPYKEMIEKRKHRLERGEAARKNNVDVFHTQDYRNIHYSHFRCENKNKSVVDEKQINDNCDDIFECLPVSEESNVSVDLIKDGQEDNLDLKTDTNAESTKKNICSNDNSNLSYQNIISITLSNSNNMYSNISLSSLCFENKDEDNIIQDNKHNNDASGYFVDVKANELSKSLNIVPISEDLKEKQNQEQKFVLCRYCGNDIATLNFARHLQRKHAEEKEVIDIMEYPKNSKARRKAFALLRNDTNFDLYINGMLRPNRCHKLPCPTPKVIGVLAILPLHELAEAARRVLDHGPSMPVG
ncbi:hypothetical protein FQR65_LT16635 [Abscondita terminalis]|nr:hypothetical protein FQR65_LT16635 [Abscondita terminalis]